MKPQQPEPTKPTPDQASDSTKASKRNATRIKVGIVLGAAALAVVVISCATVSRPVVAPPQIPGATFVGSATCAECHEAITKQFKTATHARLEAKGENAKNMGCESCHGAGSLH